MSKQTKLLLLSGLLVVVCVLAVTVPSLAAGNTNGISSGNAVSMGDLIMEVPQTTSADLVTDITIISPEDLPEGVCPSVPGYNPNREEVYEGPSAYSLFYDYGFADKYGRLDYALPGYSDEARFNLANAYIKYTRAPRFTEPHEVLVSGANEVTGESESAYITVGPDSEEFLRIMPFEEFLAGYETFVVSGQGGIEEYLGVLLEKPIPEEARIYLDSLAP